ncbi:MAG TPA: hypothetical protein VG328_20555 [Stellaceae bacterium]|jgi:hypothetical protein|nr:hypothetical protein [Stellaceae bacterium]
MTDKVDAQGYFVLGKHAVVILAPEGASTINCADFDMVPGIIFGLEIAKADEYFRIEWDASYGVNGSITTKQLQITVEPGKPSAE